MRLKFKAVLRVLGLVIFGLPLSLAWADSDELIQKAEQAFQQDRLEKAYVLFEKTLQQEDEISDKTRIELLMKLVLVCGRLNRFEKGTKAFAKAISLGLKVHAEPPIYGNPKAAKLIYEAASVRMKGDWQKSNLLAKKAGKLIPFHPQPDYVLAVNCFHIKDYKKSLDLIYKALKKDILFGYGWTNLAKIHFFREEKSKAAYYYPMVIKLYPQSKYQSLWRKRWAESKG